MNDEIDPILVGETDDIEVGTVESFEHEDITYAVYHLEPGYFCTQGICNCEDRAPLSESEIEGEELEMYQNLFMGRVKKFYEMNNIA